MKLDIEKLKGLAEVATQGEWTCGEKPDGRFWHIACGSQAIGATHSASKNRNPEYANMFEANAKYIAAANPAAVLELIADVEANRHEREVVCANYDQLKAENEDGLAVIRTLKEQLNCYMKDAERYRILRNERFRPGRLSSNPEMAKYLDEYMICGDKMDAVIDAEIAKDSF